MRVRPLVFATSRESDQLIGTIACNIVDQDQGHIRGVAVFPTQQGLGGAAQLLSCAESQLRESRRKHAD